MVVIDTDFPGGNAVVTAQRGNEIELTKELRDTTTAWFYWSFRARFSAPGTYRFRFLDGAACGPRGPAASRDDGRTWTWLGAESVFGEAREGFLFAADPARDNGIRFCVGMQYQPLHWEAFLARHAGSPFLASAVLTESRCCRRPVPLAYVEEAACGPRETVFLTARNHCCEMMADYALEGILESALGNDELGADLRRRFRFAAVPFVDLDGVIAGDQGKNRRPHDYNRDYNDAPLYPEVRAVQQLMRQLRPAFVLDLHDPWLYGGTHERIHFPGPKEPLYEERLLRFSHLLAEAAPPEAPHDPADNILFGTGWNVDANYRQGRSCAAWARAELHPLFANSLEIPYANAGAVTLTPEAVRRLGRAVARTLLAYSDALRG